jgi:AbiTii-like protein
MSSLIEELQLLAVKRETRTSDLLRFAKLVAAKLHVSEASLWVDHELNGYPPGSTLPDYRTVSCRPKQLTDRGWLPVHFADPEDIRKVSSTQVNSAVRELEALLDRPDGHLGQPFPAGLVEALRKNGFRLTEGMYEIGAPQIERILDSVRGRVLDWAIALENAGVRGDGLTFSVREREAAATVSAPTVVHNVFNAPVGAVQTGANSTAQVAQPSGLSVGDVALLVAALRDAIPADREDVLAAVADLEEEVSLPSPKQSRLRSSLTFLWTAAKDISTVGQFVLQIAQTYGIHLPGMP